MKFGFIPTEGGRFFRQALDEVVLGEELGFASVFMEEHHGVRDHYWPTPLMVLAGFATRTERVLLGTDVLILPFYHPTQVAEEAAMLDVISGGRLVLGVAIGYRPNEFALFGQPLERRGARFEEQLTVLRQLWSTDDVRCDGTFYRLDGATIEPKPVQSGGPPIWIGGWGPLALRRAARLANAWVPGPTARLEKLQAARATYEAELRAIGRDPAQTPRPLTREVIVAETDQRARELAERHLLINYRDEYGGGSWNHPLIGKEDATRVDEFEAIAQDRFVVGSPDSCIRQIQHFVETYNPDHFICRLYFPGLPHEHIMAELRLLAREVFPAFPD